VGVTSEQAADEVMDRTAAAEKKAEKKGDASQVVKDINLTGPEIYQSKIASVDGNDKDS
jgi:hypothetical protein